MSNRRKGLLLIISSILILAFVVTACTPAATQAPAEEPPAAEEPAEEAPAEEAPAEEPPAAEEPAEEAPAAPAERELVKIAFIGPLTGQNAAMGTGGLNSVTLAVQQANANPDYKYTYEIVPIDDECKPEVAVQAALMAASDTEIIASAGHYCSMAAIATADTFHNNGLANIVWGAVLPAITYGNDYIEVSRVNGTQVEQNQANAKFMAEVRGAKKISILYDTSDYGKGHLEWIKHWAPDYGLEILSEQGITIDQGDFTTELTKIKAENPDILYLGALTDVGVPVRTQMVKLGMNNIPLEGTSGIKTDAFIEGVGAENAEGVVAWLDGPPLEELPGGPAFMEAYNAAGFKEPPEAYGPFAYVAAEIIIKAIEEVGPDRAKVAEKINVTDLKDTIIGPVKFNEYGQNEIPLASPYVVQDGKWVYWPKSEYASGLRKMPGAK
jgi:branched-chain amino acid transport system substrate-binding protein